MQRRGTHHGAVLVCAALAIGACRGARGEPSDESVDPRAAPVQEMLGAGGAEDAALPDRQGARFVPRARYRIAARVLSTERYYLGWQSTLSPLDLALGWGAMADPGVDRWIEWHQRGRWYFWYWSADSPYRNEAIRNQSANVHVVPATKNLTRALLALDPGDLVRLDGWLVDIQGEDGERWGTSLSRTDTGDRSCELLYVTELLARGARYQ